MKRTITSNKGICGSKKPEAKVECHQRILFPLWYRDGSPDALDDDHGVTDVVKLPKQTSSVTTFVIVEISKTNVRENDEKCSATGGTTLGNHGKVPALYLWILLTETIKEASGLSDTIEWRGSCIVPMDPFSWRLSKKLVD
jgi:hypothetical protein